ncbi:MAG TPA: glycosyltransferase family 2 protein [Burkholderiales bacterium]|nr:glycosyltransferase family 2 protein [Burkholderiales bacterium]
MKFSVITPCLNAAAHIGETAASVLGQSALRDGVELEYIVCDGGSTDGTIEALRPLASPAMRVSSEPDGGMYDALARGLRLATGDVVAYLNAGDYYHPHAFRAVRQFLSERPDCRWLTGFAMDYSPSGALVHVVLPFRFRRRLQRCGAYGSFLPFLQQESTFWRRELLERVDLERLAGLRLAGDYYLWRCFAEAAELHVVSAHLGGFRFHEGQKSEDLGAYRAEMRTLADAPGPVDLALMLFDRLMWLAPPLVKKTLNPDALHLFDQRTGRWT